MSLLSEMITAMERVPFDQRTPYDLPQIKNSKLDDAHTIDHLRTVFGAGDSNVLYACKECPGIYSLVRLDHMIEKTDEINVFCWISDVFGNDVYTLPLLTFNQYFTRASHARVTSTNNQ